MTKNEPETYANPAEAHEAIKRHEAKYHRLRDEMNDLHVASRDAGRPTLTPGEQERWDRLEAGSKRALEDVAVARDAWSEMIMRGVSTGRLGIEDGDGARGAPYINRGVRDPWANAPATRDEARSYALTAIERSTAPDHAKEAATALVESSNPQRSGVAAEWARVSSSPAYLRAFHKMWEDPTRGHLLWTPEEHAAHADVVQLQRAASLTDASGGYMVPFSLDPAIMLTGAGSVNPMRQVSRVVQTTTDTWNGVTSDGVTAHWYAEADEASDDTPTLGQPSIKAERGSVWLPFSIEIGMDAVNWAQEAAKLMADAKDQLEAEAFTLGAGSGSNKPKGVITAVAADSGSIVAPTTAETFASTDTYAVQEAVPARWRQNGTFMANLSIINKVRQFDSSGGHSQIAQLGEATPSRLLGWPLFENSHMDGVYSAAATASHNYLLLAGDFQHYVIVDRIGTTVELIPHLFGDNKRPTGQRGYFMWFRTGGDCTNTDAFRLLDIPTTA